MDEAMETTLDFKASDVEACRICLAIDVKLYSLRDTHLGTCMESIGGFTKSHEGLPDYVCYECAPILIKCNKLIEKSKTARATVVDIFKKNGQINKTCIQVQKRSELNLQSSLNSYLLTNYFHIKYDDESNTSDFIKTESDPNEKINIKSEIKDANEKINIKSEIKDPNENINIKSEIKEKASDVDESEILDMLKELSKADESDKDDDVQAIEVDVPVIEIGSDDERTGDDFISLNSVKGLLAPDDDIPFYNRQKIRPIGVAKVHKKKKKKVVPIVRQTPFNDSYIVKFFYIRPQPGRPNDWKYFCKHCPQIFYYMDEAKDHTFIGCQNPQTINSDRSALPNAESATNTVQLNQPNIWQEWPGGSRV